MFFSAAKAVDELGLPQTPAEVALADAVDWFVRAATRPGPVEGGVNAGQFVSRLTRKSRSNFFYAFLCLPRRQRDAIYAVYAFCRIVDDAVDLGRGPRRAAARARPLARGDRARLRRGRPSIPPGSGCRRPSAPFPSRARCWTRSSPASRWISTTPRYETFEDLYPYCYRVASAVGLACIEIFGYRDPRARDYAVHLGIALQLTNILRDVAGRRARRARLPPPGGSPPLRRDRGGPGRRALHARVRRADDLGGGARPRVLRAGLGRAASRGRRRALRRGDHGAHVLGAAARPRGAGASACSAGGSRCPRIGGSPSRSRCWMRARWGRRRPAARPRRA